MKKKINIPLMVLTFIIWGIIVYSIAEAVWFGKENRGQEMTELVHGFEENHTATSPQEFEFEYLDNDPFSLSVKEKLKRNIESIPVSEPVQPKQVIEEETIQFAVSGVVINSDSKNIMMKDITNNEIVFLKEGDEYRGIKVVKVQKDQVEFIKINSGKQITSKIE